jgi:hypothetical protein
MTVAPMPLIGTAVPAAVTPRVLMTPNETTPT